MLNSVPRKLGDVNKSVNAAKVNKRTKVGERLYNALVYLINLCACPECGFLFLFKFTHERNLIVLAVKLANIYFNSVAN